MFKLISSPVARQYLVILTANLSVICFGLNIMWQTPVLLKLNNETETALSRPVTDEEESWIVSLTPLSGLFFYYTMGIIMDKIGRRTCLVIGFIPRLTMCFMQQFTTEIWVVCLARAIGGISEAFVLSVVPTYTSEIASKDCRAGLGTIIQVASGLGMMIALGLGPFLSYSNLNLMHTCIASVVAVIVWFVPETPYYLYSKGQKEKSINNLIYLRGSAILANEEIKQYSLIDNRITKIEIFKERVVFKTLAKVIFLSIFFQAVGYTVLLFYMMKIFKSCQTTINEDISTLISGCLQLAACLSTMVIADKLNRKTILVTTFIGIGLGMIGLGTFFQLKQETNQVSGFMNFLPLISMTLVIVCFNAGPGAVFWTVIAELFDSRARATGVSIGMGTAVTTLFLVSKYFPIIIKIMGPAFVYWIFSFNSIFVAMFIMCCIPETKGKTFSEIQTALGRKATTAL